jgi:hypothetical protein
VGLSSTNRRAQEVLADPFRQGAATAPAVPGRPICRRRQFRRQLSRANHRWGTLMRHFLCAGPVTALPFCMRMAAAQAGLIAATGRTHGVAAGLFGAGRGAVTVAAITAAADQYGGAATGAQVASSGKIHGQSGPMDCGHKRALREILCRQRCPRQGASGRDIGTGLAVGAGVAPAFPPAGPLFTSSAPTLPRFACQTTIAAQSIRRKPCGQQTVKPA